MKRLNTVQALIYRAFVGTWEQKGRIVEMLLFPFSQLMIWGLFLNAGLIDTDIAKQLFIINLIWSCSTLIQGQANLLMMSDLWSNEFPELFRSGIDPISYLVAMLCYGIILGLSGTIVFIFLCCTFFDFTFFELFPFIYSFPAFTFFSLTLAIFIAALIVRLNSTYGFIMSGLLTFMVMLSSPYTPIKNLPYVLQQIALYSPLGLIFEYIRCGDSNLLIKSILISTIMC